MKTYPSVILFATLAFLMCAITGPFLAQEPKPTPKIEKIILIVNAENINKILIVSVDGQWIPNARSFQLDTKIGTSEAKPTVKCVMYRGVFAPTDPEIKTWQLESLIVATDVEFQKVLDGLQGGAFTAPGTVETPMPTTIPITPAE